MALGLGIGPSGGGGGGGASLTQDLTYGASVSIGDMNLSHDMRLDTDSATAAAFTLNKPTGPAGNFLITARNTNGVVDLNLGADVVLENTNFGNGWNNADGAVNIIAGLWDGTTARITIIGPGVDGESPIVLAEPLAALFDGSNDWATRGGQLTGVSDGPSGTLSFWILAPRLATFTDRRILQAADNRMQVVHDDLTNEISYSFRNAAGTINLAFRSDEFVIYGDGWVHVLASWNSVNDTATVYLNDENVGATITAGTGTDDNIDYTPPSADWAIGTGFAAPVQLFHGALAHLWFDPTQELDLSVESNRRKFITVDRQPVDLGADGSTPTGAAPAIYLNGDGDDFFTNLGAGGGFTPDAGTSLAVPATKP